MKNFKIFFLFIFSTSISFAQIDCKPFLPPAKGSKWEVTNYNKKGKVTGKVTYELIEKIEEGDKITFTIKNLSYDKKGKQIFENTYTAYCENGQFSMNMAAKMDGKSLSAYQNMELDIDATDFEIPTFNEEAGTTLKDGSLKVGLGGSGGIGLNMKVDITDREVETKENITTPAGTFDCLVISQKIKTKLVMNIKGSSKEWYAENVGMVRSESYNKKGKMVGYSELTKLETPE